MDYELIDTHCHPQFPQYDEDRDVVIRKAVEARIGMVCVGTDIATSQQAIGLAESYEGVYATVGLHPNDALDAPYKSAQYEALLSHPKVVAVGEIGLDYYRTKDAPQQEAQRRRLALQLDMAVRNDLPVILHCRDAHADMIEMLERLGDDKPAGVVHSFTSSWENAEKYLAMDYVIGLNGIITFARDYDEAVRNTPLKSILIETDAPYLTPEPYRGRRNEPIHVIEVARKLAELREADYEEILKVTTSNALRLFSKVDNALR